MAQFRAPAFAAVWLIVALAMIVLAVPPCQVGATLDIFGSSKTIEEIKTTKPSDRSDKEWSKLGADCTKNSNAKVMLSLGVTKWLSKLKAIEQSHCNRLFEETLMEFLIKTKIYHAGCLDIVREYLSLYLDTCRYTEHFTKVIQVAQAIKQKPVDHLSFVDDQKLDSYLIDNLLQTTTEYKTEKKVEMISILSAISEISSSERISKEPYCSQGFEIKGPISSEGDNAHLHLFRKLHLNFYLDQCGFEEAFKKMGGNINQIPHDSLYTTLYSMLKGRFTNKLELKWVFSAIKRLSALDDISKETDCTEKLLNEIFDSLLPCKYDHSELHKIISGYFALYLDKCGFEELFNKRIEHMKEGSEGGWKLYKFSTLHSYLLEVFWNSGRKNVTWMMTAMKELSALDSISDMADCTEERHKPLLKRLAESEKFEDFHLITADYFALYLENCGFEEIFKRRVAHMRQNSGDNRDLADFATLHSLLLEKIRKYGEKTVSDMMSILRQLSPMERISEPTECIDDTDTFLFARVFTKHLARFGDFSSITADFFSLYLEKCGSEESFKKRVDSIVRNFHSKWDRLYPTLFSIIRNKFWKRETLAVIWPIIKKLPMLDSTADEIDCSEKFRTDLLNLVHTYKKQSRLFYTLMKNYYALFLEKCGSERLKKELNKIEDSSTFLAIFAQETL